MVHPENAELLSIKLDFGFPAWATFSAPPHCGRWLYVRTFKKGWVRRRGVESKPEPEEPFFWFLVKLLDDKKVDVFN